MQLSLSIKTNVCSDCTSYGASNSMMIMQNVPQLLHPAVSAACRGSEVYDAARSASNPAEAQAVKRLVKQLVDRGVRRSDIGIICFFHAQVGSWTVWTYKYTLQHCFQETYYLNFDIVW